MIQVYKAGNTDFESNGDAVLHPEKCEVEMNVNGAWTLNLENPDDENVGIIENESVISVDTPVGKRQLFRIYDIENDGSKTVQALPIFFDAVHDSMIFDSRPTNKLGQDALDIITQGTRYSGKSDIKESNTAYYQQKNIIEALSSDDENSFLNRWGGEIIYDNYKVIINERCGADRGARVALGYNLSEIKEHINFSSSDFATRVIPKAYNGYLLSGDKHYIDSPNIDKFTHPYIKIIEYPDIKLQIDCNEDEVGYKDQTELDIALTEAVKKDFESGIDVPEMTYDISIVDLAKTDQYKDFKDLVEIKLGDTVTVYHKMLKVEAKARVSRVVWDCIKQEIKEITLGNVKSDYFNNVSSTMARANKAIKADGTVRGGQIRETVDLALTKLYAMREKARLSGDKAILFEDKYTESETYGAMAIGTTGFMIAKDRKEDNSDWNWSTFGTGAGFIADLIVAGRITSKNYDHERNTGFAIDLDSGLIEMSKILLRTTSEFNTEMEIGSGKLTLHPPAVEGYNTSEFFFRLIPDFDKTGEYIVQLRPKETDEGKKKNTYYFDLQADLLQIWAPQVDFANTTKIRTLHGAGITGTVNFSDGSYLKFECGICIGGKTASGEDFNVDN